MLDFMKNSLLTVHKQSKQAKDFFKFMGPGILVTVGFIDPGNWAANLAAGADYGYALLWVVTLSTIMLILLQHNVAHLGIVSGQCLSECATSYLPKMVSRPVLGTAILAAIATALAELMGAAIALRMLFHIPLLYGALLTAVVCTVMLITNSYLRLEKIIASFVSLIALAYVIELYLVPVDWSAAAVGWVMPAEPKGSLLVIMSVLGAVIMPHNLFLHSEIIQNKEWNLEDEEKKKQHLRFEFLDTLFSMGIGWAINSAMVILAAATFYMYGISVSELEQAQELLMPLVGDGASLLFALALLFAGFASTTTAGMAGASIFAGMFGESYDVKDIHTKVGLGITFIPALLLLFFVNDPFYGLIVSQMLLSVQLPFTIFLQLYLTSSKKVMGEYVNRLTTNIMLWTIGIIVTLLNLYLLYQTLMEG